jgi:hypothetical protein
MQTDYDLGRHGIGVRGSHCELRKQSSRAGTVKPRMSQADRFNPGTCRDCFRGCRLVRATRDIVIKPIPRRTMVAGSGTLAPGGFSSAGSTAASSTKGISCAALACGCPSSTVNWRPAQLLTNRPLLQTVSGISEYSTSAAPWREKACESQPIAPPTVWQLLAQAIPAATGKPAVFSPAAFGALLRKSTPTVTIKTEANTHGCKRDGSTRHPIIVTYLTVTIHFYTAI